LHDNRLFSQNFEFANLSSPHDSFQKNIPPTAGATDTEQKDYYRHLDMDLTKIKFRIELDQTLFSSSDFENKKITNIIGNQIKNIQIKFNTHLSKY
jgi:hypothetical protein